MLRFRRLWFRRLVPRAVAGAWLGVFALLWATLPALDARAGHSPRSLANVQDADAASVPTVSSTDGCDFCDLLQATGIAPAEVEVMRTPPRSAETPRTGSSGVVRAAAASQAPARAPPTA